MEAMASRQVSKFHESTGDYDTHSSMSNYRSYNVIREIIGELQYWLCKSKICSDIIWLITTGHVSIYKNQEKIQSTNALLKLDDQIIWNRALSNKWGRLTQGNTREVISTYTIWFIAHYLVPKYKEVTYTSFMCNNITLKTYPWRVRLVVGGNKLIYVEDVGSKAANFLENKILLN